MAAKDAAAGDRFTWTGDDVVLSQCVYCTRLLPAEAGRGAACAAFPAGIPRPILANQYDHRNPYPDPATGDPADAPDGESLTFEARPTVPADMQARLYAVLDAAE